jgi:hypothetical protein
MILIKLLVQILNSKNSLLISTGLLTYVAVSIFLISTGLSVEAAMELGCASGGGSAALIAFIDSWLGISNSIIRQQKDRQRHDIDRDLQSGQIGAIQALEIFIRQQLLAEISEIPWYNFTERARIKQSAENRYWAVKNILPYTLSSLPHLSLDNLCMHLYEVENIVAQHKQNTKKLPPVSATTGIVDKFFNGQRRSLP